MNSENIQFVKTPQWIYVQHWGDNSLDFVTELWNQIAVTCERENCFVVLGVGHSSQPLSSSVSLAHERIFRRFGIDKRYLIAWVEAEAEATANIRLAEQILVGKEITNGKLFFDEADAAQWLSARVKNFASGN